MDQLSLAPLFLSFARVVIDMYDLTDKKTVLACLLTLGYTRFLITRTGDSEYGVQGAFFGM
jgi:hypothetical protein